MKKALFSILALAMLFAPLADAQGRGGPPAERNGRMMERIAERLELSDAVAEQLQETMASHRKSASPLMDDLLVARRSLEKQISGDDFDEAAIREAAARVGELEADVAVSRAQHWHDIRNLLTDEQWAEFKEMRERRERGAIGHGNRQRHPGGPARGR